MTKRLFDIIFSFFGLIVLSPLFLIVALMIKINSSGPVFYKGERVGRNGKLFKIFKFRTMIKDAEKQGIDSTPLDDSRITKVGRFLRKYYIDEIPQLINILNGEMSFVGPRPQVKWATDLYADEEKIILTVKPGLTDFASLKFPNEGKILKGSKDPDKDYLQKIHPEKTRLQIEYLKNRSFWVDLKIIFKTIFIIISKLYH